MSNLTEVAAHGPGAPRAALMADWSADGATVVYASTPHPGQWIDLGDGAIAKLRYSHAGGVHSFSEPEFIVRGPLQLPGGAYTNFFFPSLSGDGAVVVFNGARAPWRSNPARAAGQRLFLADADGPSALAPVPNDRLAIFTPMVTAVKPDAGHAGYGCAVLIC